MLQVVEDPRVKMKVCAVGEEAVGKTSLIRRFVADVFDADYTRTIGTLISKKVLEVETTDGTPCTVDAIIWDIMGRQRFMDLLKEAYFYRAQGAFAVLDITRRETLENLHPWLEGIQKAVGNIPLVVFANKADREDEAQVVAGDVAALGEEYDCLTFFTSAKTGENVAEGFEALIRAALERHDRTVTHAANGGDAEDPPGLSIGR